MPWLISLNCFGNQIGSIPDDIGALGAMQRLLMGYNAITDIPDAFRGMESLRELNLSGNPLKDFPMALCGMGSLQQLMVCGCGLSSLPDELCENKALKNLLVTSNGIRELPENIGNLSNLMGMRALLCFQSSCSCSLPDACDRARSWTQPSNLAPQLLLLAAEAC